MSKTPVVSAEAEEKAERLWQSLKAEVARRIQRCLDGDPSLKIDDLEADAVGLGDLLARTLLGQMLETQTPITESECQQAREQALKQADPEVAARYRPEDLRVTRIPDKQCVLKTARGSVPYAREYLYCPDLRVGVFPPRLAAGHPRRQGHASRRAPHS